MLCDVHAYICIYMYAFVQFLQVCAKVYIHIQRSLLLADPTPGRLILLYISARVGS